MKNKKILLICQYFYPEKISSGILPFELATELSKKGYEVTALVGYPKEYISKKSKVIKKETFKNIHIHRISYIQANRRKSIGRIINMLSFSISILFHPSLFVNNNTFICFTNPPLLPIIITLYSKLLKKRNIIVIYDLYPDSPIRLGYISEDSIISKIFNKFNLFCFKNAYKVIAVSSEMKNYLVMAKRLSSNKVEIIHNWYQDIFEKCIYGPVKFPIKILYGGNMGIAQDMTTIMKTAQLLNHDQRFHFVFAGHGSKKGELENFIKENGINNCTIYDFLPKDEYDKLLYSSQMTILSLHENICGLGSPSKYYGYLALKKPVIAIIPNETDIANDIKRYEIGIHINSNQEKILADKLLYIAEHTNILKEMSDNAYQLFTNEYTLEKSAEKYISIIED